MKNFTLIFHLLADTFHQAFSKGLARISHTVLKRFIPGEHLGGIIIPVLCLLFTAIPSSGHCFCLWPIKGPHRGFLGPEFYYAKRTKKGGSEQTGWLYGGRGIYERKRHCGIYWALDGYYAQGNLDGETASGKTLKSDITDRQIEGQLGYTFCYRPLKKLSITPYGGYGYFDSRNDFKKPSPLECEFYNYFQYGSAGMLASFFPYPCLETGINVKAKFMVEGKCRVKDDPDYDRVTLIIENKTQYEVDLPFRYYTCWRNKSVVVEASPFYRFRHYGGRMNWPFDFIDTRFRIYGGRVLLNINF